MFRAPATKDIQVNCAQGSLATSILEVPESTFPAVILLHGFLSNRREIPVATENAGMFEVIAKKLAERSISTVRFDFRGCGESQGLALGACTPTSMVQDILSVVASDQTASVLNRGFVLVGWCQGALAATHAALLGLQGCRRIVLLNPFVELRRTLVHVYGEKVCVASTRVAPDTFLEIRMASGKSRNVIASFFREMFQIDELDLISRVPLPVHILKATKDTILPNQNAFFADLKDFEGTCDLIDTDHAFGSFTNSHDLVALTEMLVKFVQFDREELEKSCQQA
jgi:pimeloyl-ACP methyl ester carboxylesterase